MNVIGLGGVGGDTEQWMIWLSDVGGPILFLGGAALLLWGIFEPPAASFRPAPWRLSQTQASRLTNAFRNKVMPFGDADHVRVNIAHTASEYMALAQDIVLALREAGWPNQLGHSSDESGPETRGIKLHVNNPEERTPLAQATADALTAAKIPYEWVRHRDLRRAEVIIWVYRRHESDDKE